MKLRVSGQNLDIGEALRSQVEGRVASALSKYFDGAYSGHVTIARDGNGFRTECVLHLDSGITLDATGAAMDAYASADQSADRIEKRLRRYKRRLKDRPAGERANGAKSAYAVIERPSEDLPEDDEYHPIVIAEMTRDLHRMSVSEAVTELDLTGTGAVVFLHAGTGRVNVVYRRRDGAIGWVDPPEARP